MFWLPSAEKLTNHLKHDVEKQAFASAHRLYESGPSD